jgi:toxin ParE1/3/4
MCRVVLRPSADADLEAIYWFLIETTGSDHGAIAIVRRLRQHCERLNELPTRGRPRDDIREGLRTLAFERRAVIAYFVESGAVIVTRIFYRGQDFEALLGLESEAG